MARLKAAVRAARTPTTWRPCPPGADLDTSLPAEGALSLLQVAVFFDLRGHFGAVSPLPHVPAELVVTLAALRIDFLGEELVVLALGVPLELLGAAPVEAEAVAGGAGVLRPVGVHQVGRAVVQPVHGVRQVHAFGYLLEEAHVEGIGFPLWTQETVRDWEMDRELLRTYLRHKGFLAPSFVPEAYESTLVGVIDEKGR